MRHDVTFPKDTVSLASSLFKEEESGALSFWFLGNSAILPSCLSTR